MLHQESLSKPVTAKAALSGGLRIIDTDCVISVFKAVSYFGLNGYCSRPHRGGLDELRIMEAMTV